LDLCIDENIENFFYISSSEIFDDIDTPTESSTPKATTKNGQILISGEQICKFYQTEFDVNVTIIRVPFLYDDRGSDSLLTSVLTKLKNNQPVLLPGGEDDVCDFLHIKDVASFIRSALEEETESDHYINHLSSGKIITLDEFATILRDFFPSARFSFPSERKAHTKPLVVDNARKQYGWSPLHNVALDLPELYDRLINGLPEEKASAGRGLIEFYQTSRIIKWIELIGGALLMQYLSDFTSTLIQFKFVDFRLLFVVIMGSVYGIRFGLFAALLASLSILFTWYKLELDWALLTYNIGNWFPFVVYFAAGAITGYVKDKKENEIEYEKSQTNLIFEKYQFLYGVFNEISILKDEFREQIFRSRDSFGKMYNISQELNALNADEVFIKALTVLEDVMSAESIAIYSVDSSSNYLRLEVNSPSLNGEASKSIELSNLPALKETLSEGIIFQNKELLPDYPAYAAPIMNQGKPAALVAIWHASFDQFSMYHYNLFKVITGLIQDSLARASLFKDANISKNYLPETNILNTPAFIEAINIRTEMKKNKISDYQLLKFEAGQQTPTEIDKIITTNLRSVDIVGVWENDYYVVLNRADADEIEAIKNRLGKSGINTDIVDNQEFLHRIT
jgi:UDP-glucose 4-epimerase